MPARASAAEGLAGTYRLLQVTYRFRIFELLLLVVVPSLEEMQQEEVAENRGLKSKCS